MRLDQAYLSDVDPSDHLRHEAQAINEFGVAVAFLFPDAVSDHMRLVGKPPP